MSNIDKRLAKLERLMTAMAVKPARKKKRATKSKQAVVAPPVQNPVVRAIKQRKRGVAQEDGSMTVSREELLVAVTGNGTEVSGSIDLKPDSFSWLKNVANSFERITWHQCQIYWKPAVGTSVNGLVVYGVDWNSKTPATLTRAIIQAMTPVCDHPLWQDNRGRPLILPVSKLMTRKEYSLQSDVKPDSQPAILSYHVASSDKMFLGEIWIKYRVTMFGTRS